MQIHAQPRMPSGEPLTNGKGMPEINAVAGADAFSGFRRFGEQTTECVMRRLYRQLTPIGGTHKECPCVREMLERTSRSQVTVNSRKSVR